VALNAPRRIRKINQSFGGKIVKFGVLNSGLANYERNFSFFIVSWFLCLFVQNPTKENLNKCFPLLFRNMPLQKSSHYS